MDILRLQDFFNEVKKEINKGGIISSIGVIPVFEQNKEDKLICTALFTNSTNIDVILNKEGLNKSIEII